MLSRYNASLPLKSDYLKNVFKEIRDFKANFKSRFELNHNMDGVHDTTDGDCDGYHTKLDMPACDYDAEVLAGTIPEIADDTTYGVLHCREIDSVIELCFKNNAGTWQITDKGYVATDLDNWDDRTFDSSVTGENIFYDNTNSLYVLIGFNSSSYGKIYTSPDGITWTQRFSTSAIKFYSGCYGNAIDIAVGWYIYSSTDGITWTLRAAPSGTLTGVCYSGGTYVAVGKGSSNNAIVYSSTDGITWTLSSTFGGGGIYLYDVCYGNSLFIAVGWYIYSSTDGITWIQRLVSSSAYIYSICYGSGKFVAVGDNMIYMSTDGTTWTSLTMTGYSFRSVIYGGGKFVAVGVTGIIYYSRDGSTWEEASSPITGTINNVFFKENIKLSGEGFKNMFLVAGDSGEVRTSQKYIEVI